MNDGERRRELLRLLKLFGSQCYWYGEDSGDYGMDQLDEDTEWVSELITRIEAMFGEPV